MRKGTHFFYEQRLCVVHEVVGCDCDFLSVEEEGGGVHLGEEGAAGGPGELEAEGVVGVFEGWEAAAVAVEFFDLFGGLFVRGDLKGCPGSRRRTFPPLAWTSSIFLIAYRWSMPGSS